MKKLFVVTLGLIGANSALANNGIPKEYQGCWSGQNDAYHEITKNMIGTPTGIDYIEENILSVSKSNKMKGGIAVKTDYNFIYHFKLSKDKKTLYSDDFGKKYKRMSCSNH